MKITIITANTLDHIDRNFEMDFFNNNIYRMAAIKGYLNSLVENKRKKTPTRKRVPHCQLFNTFLRQDKSLLKYIMSVGTFYILSLFRSYSINIKLESFLYTFDIAFNYIRKMKSMIIQLCVFMGKVTLDIYELFFTL